MEAQKHSVDEVLERLLIGRFLRVEKRFKRVEVRLWQIQQVQEVFLLMEKNDLLFLVPVILLIIFIQIIVHRIRQIYAPLNSLS